MGGNKRYSKDFFKKLRDKSLKMYASIPALNWGEVVDGKYVMKRRYFFKWKVRTGPKKSRKNIDIDVKQYILDYKEKVEKEGKELFVFAGVDSQNRLQKTDFAVVIVLYVGEKGGHMLETKFSLHKIYDYRYRLLREADILGELSREFEPFFKEHGLKSEWHLDYNDSTNHKSNGVVIEATNYLRHLGVEGKIKKESWAASAAADHLLR